MASTFPNPESRSGCDYVSYCYRTHSHDSTLPAGYWGMMLLVVVVIIMYILSCGHPLLLPSSPERHDVPRVVRPHIAFRQHLSHKQRHGQRIKQRLKQHVERRLERRIEQQQREAAQRSSIHPGQEREKGRRGLLQDSFRYTMEDGNLDRAQPLALTPTYVKGPRMSKAYRSRSRTHVAPPLICIQPLRKLKHTHTRVRTINYHNATTVWPMRIFLLSIVSFHAPSLCLRSPLLPSTPPHPHTFTSQSRSKLQASVLQPTIASLHVKSYIMKCEHSLSHRALQFGPLQPGRQLQTSPLISHEHCPCHSVDAMLTLQLSCWCHPAATHGFTTGQNAPRSCTDRSTLSSHNAPEQYLHDGGGWWFYGWRRCVCREGGCRQVTRAHMIVYQSTHDKGRERVLSRTHVRLEDK